MLGTPEQNTVPQVGSHQRKVEGQNHLPCPVGHASFYADWNTVGFLGCKCTLSGHVQFFTYQYPQVHFCRAALNPFITQNMHNTFYINVKVLVAARKHSLCSQYTYFNSIWMWLAMLSIQHHKIQELTVWTSSYLQNSNAYSKYIMKWACSPFSSIHLIKKERQMKPSA